ncbi:MULTISPECIES: C40 family peptidase [Streptomyces]|uniref:C40 family peptidase n=1 Tax=Streptomyces TaxID=1883 RepID=UPI001F3158C5|nr:MULTISPECIES: NlpC/P60 family protein [Streptomyces]
MDASDRKRGRRQRRGLRTPAALGRLGTMYQWGGSCTNPHGPHLSERCDCSSLTRRAYGVARKEITRTTYTRLHDGRAVPENAILPGDLLFARGTADAPERTRRCVRHRQ